MKVICAWCEHEGRPSFIGERAPLFDERPTHGICRTHLDGYLLSCGVGAKASASRAYESSGSVRLEESGSRCRAYAYTLFLAFRRWNLADYLEKLRMRPRSLTNCTGKRIVSSSAS